DPLEEADVRLRLLPTEADLEVADVGAHIAVGRGAVAEDQPVAEPVPVDPGLSPVGIDQRRYDSAHLEADRLAAIYQEPAMLRGDLHGVAQIGALPAPTHPARGGTCRHKRHLLQGLLPEAPDG